MFAKKFPFHSLVLLQPILILIRVQGSDEGLFKQYVVQKYKKYKIKIDITTSVTRINHS